MHTDIKGNICDIINYVSSYVPHSFIISPIPQCTVNVTSSSELWPPLQINQPDQDRRTTSVRSMVCCLSFQSSGQLQTMFHSGVAAEVSRSDGVVCLQ